MAHPDESVDFSLIEEQKENIQSLPGGRSARALAAVLSSGAVSNSSSTGGLNETNEANATIKKEFEQELQTIDESDDPLDIYDRYVKWTFDAYPSAQATPQSGLLPLLERATKAFLTSSDYKNDPRYLRLWLHYIRLFSDAPREVFTFLTRNGIGERLALFYEEFAAWLESAGRITQAEQIYEMGLEKEARPVERLSRKYREFLKRVESNPRTNEPTSPVLPKVRPALQAKIDPFASARIPPNPQTQSQKTAAPATAKSTRTGKPKMQIFSDADADGAPDGEETPSDTSKGHDTIGFMKERKKENTYEPKPWKGQTLKSTSRPERAPKLQVYKDESLAKSTALISDKTLRLRETVNPRSGKMERIYANLELLYPRGGRGREAEVSIDEARAASRGWLSRDWSRCIKKKQVKPRQEGKHMSKTMTQTAPMQDSDEAALPQAFEEKLVIHRDAPVGSEPAPIEKSKPKKSRSPKVVETSSQTQTIKTKLDSPTVSKVRRKNGSSEPTMTFHTRAATDEIYGIFNQPLKAELGGEDEDSPYQSEGYDDDDFTATTNVTGRLSGVTSDFCEGDTTYLNKSTADEDDIKVTAAAGDWTGEDVLEQTTSSFPADSQTQDKDAEEDEDDMNEQMTPVKRKFPPPPDDYDPPVGLYRDPAVMAQNRLPFMTPIVERTEMSMAYSTYRHGQRNVPNSEPADDESSLSSPSVGTEPAIESGGPPDGNETRFSVFHDESPSKKPRVEQPEPQKHVDQTCVLTKQNAQPIIPDKQCNPIDLDVKAKILKAIDPPLGSYLGFYRHTSEGSPYIKEIEHEFGRRTSGALKSRKAVTLNFENLGKHITVTHGLGKGGYASVYLAEEHVPEPCTDQETSEKNREGRLVALKVEGSLNSSWEFHMIRTSLNRLSLDSSGYNRCAESILEAYDMHRFNDQGFLTVQYCGQGTLLDLMNAVMAQTWLPQDQDELTAMFFSSELLHTMEGLHSVGVIHGDVKADNCLVRLDTTPETDEQWSVLQYSADGEGIWRRNGITLIDFGRSIDMTAFRKDVQFIADWETHAHECPEMREGRPWTHQIDLYGIASVMHLLLFRKPMEVVSTPARLGGRPTYHIKERFKRYWDQAIWSEAFDMCLNPLSPKWTDIERAACPSQPPVDENTPPEPVLPIVASMKRARHKMEAWLEANSKKKGLHTRLKHLEELMSRHKAKV